MQKELSVAFIWHFHQPNYQTQQNGIRLMPWARLHAIKDYLDMLIILDKFPKIKLNFSLDPSLIDTIEDYAYNEGHDIHSKLTVTPVEELTDDDKLYILNYFFDINYEKFISKNPRFNELYMQRFSEAQIGINDFSNQEYADIMMLFNLYWFDPIWKEKYPILSEFEEKGSNYTLNDRQKLIELNRDIIKEIIPSFKKYQEEGRIEILTSPYNHPILPILLNPNDIKTPILKHELPDCKIALAVDAKEQIRSAFEKIEQTFGKKPSGFWPSEHCISQKTLDVLANLGAKWVVTDESVLANSLKKEFVRDFRGCYEDPYDVCSLYLYRTKREKEINIIFRDSVIPNLITFEYSRHDNVASANDLFDRIKTVHDKLKNSPSKCHLLTIAMDGENSWDDYQKDGSVFLERLYSLINSDRDIKTVLVSDYVNKNKTSEKLLKKVASGSWVNQEFQLWIAEPTKNIAWKYLVQTRNDLKEAENSGRLSKEQIKQAKAEIYIAEGSDWFWWYGEPNDSGQDHIFDYMFREHLRNVYQIIERPIPSYLDMPLISVMGKPMKNPIKTFTPLMNGLIQDNDEWRNAGCIVIPDGPILQENKLLDRIYFGNDYNNLYIRFDINNYLLDSKESYKEYFSIYVYIKTYNNTAEYTSPVRTTNKTDSIQPIFLDGYNYEAKFAITHNRKYPLQFSRAQKDGIWELKWDHHIKFVKKDFIEVSIPFEDLKINPGDNFDFFFITGCSGVTEEVYPKDIPLNLTRPII